ncbi:TIGR03668 family PPOX class F420-dependent oxidoreductase [Streptomyces radicis]|uniref:TIGR03668 family PPOX class F420-dependent oxidoreductase n=1 Tax=Streptomyces radicis TaxID=1750517 RepID=A0A3A9W2T1_9ACTN|nr:TIGR03668 family PPOX class F420-dependent oxidoreductase [Streptomyces radicis]RKN07220.1 TIGR03668 family PPOX class F420-dependent oxidoreductase [Streptomyces radicis]RKN26762.1 TIGR03668 family PPOX class F420-dependent oxidoreductase [Streptomyces radicis]
MQLTSDEARSRLTGARVLRLATVDATGAPHAVPATFAVEGDTVVIAVDHKPKRHRDLKRLRNIEANPKVCVLADAYDDDWDRLWWVRGDGTARIVDGENGREAIDRLREKYRPYRELRPEGPVIEIAITRWTGWRAAPG